MPPLLPLRGPLCLLPAEQLRGLDFPFALLGPAVFGRLADFDLLPAERAERFFFLPGLADFDLLPVGDFDNFEVLAIFTAPLRGATAIFRSRVAITFDLVLLRSANILAKGFVGILGRFLIPPSRSPNIPLPPFFLRPFVFFAFLGNALSDCSLSF